MWLRPVYADWASLGEESVLQNLICVYSYEVLEQKMDDFIQDATKKARKFY